MQSTVAVPEFSSDELASIVSSAIECPRDHVTIQDHCVERFGSTVEGFLADHFALKVNVRCVNFPSGQRDRKLSFFVKVLPERNPCLAEYCKNIGTFRKEIALFVTVLPSVQKVIGGKQFSAKIYLTRDNELIVMENLKAAGYTIVTENNGLLDGFHLRKAMDALARLHAGSMIIEKQREKSLTELFPGVLDENAWIESDARKRDVENVINFWCEVVRFSEKNHKKMNLILVDLPTTIRRIYEYVKPSSQFQNALCHGDLWSNNLMFRSLAGIPEDCILVDFQMSRYVPPAYDLNLLITLSTSRIFRTQHYETLVMDYFGNLRKLLEPHKIDVPWEAFMESCSFYRSAGLIHTCLISPEVLLPQSYQQQVASRSDASCGFMPKPKVSICLKAFQMDIPYRNRLLDMLDELIDCEIFQQ